MTRKNYVALAAALARTRPEAPRPFATGTVEECSTRLGRPCASPADHEALDYSDEWRQWQTTRDAVADSLIGTNPLFDRDRFVAATLKED